MAAAHEIVEIRMPAVYHVLLLLYAYDAYIDCTYLAM